MGTTLISVLIGMTDTGLCADVIRADCSRTFGARHGLAGLIPALETQAAFPVGAELRPPDRWAGQRGSQAEVGPWGQSRLLRLVLDPSYRRGILAVAHTEADIRCLHFTLV